jgi:uracil-DNA glycosylase
VKAEPTLEGIFDGLAQFLEYQIEEGVTRIEMERRPVLAASARPAAAPAAVRPAAPAPRPAAPVPPPPPAPAVAPVPGGGLVDIAAQVAACTRCGLHAGRTQTVPGQGCPTPEILFVGEGPGEEEDRTGQAFVGPAGQLLTRMIAAMGLTRGAVFIANVVKCRPPGNRTPLPEEMTACLPYLRAQIAILRPKVIVALGGTAVQGLLGLTGITRLRGTWLNFEGIDVMPTFHPSYLLRPENQKKRWEVWEDMAAVLRRIGREPPERKGPARRDGAPTAE